MKGQTHENELENKSKSREASNKGATALHRNRVLGGNTC
jgi:hypothetical protein